MSHTKSLMAENGKRCSSGVRDQWDHGFHGCQERLQPSSRVSFPCSLLLCKALQRNAWRGETKTHDSLLLNCSQDRRGQEQAVLETCKTSPASQTWELTLF